MRNYSKALDKWVHENHRTSNILETMQWSRKVKNIGGGGMIEKVFYALFWTATLTDIRENDLIFYTFYKIHL